MDSYRDLVRTALSSPEKISEIASRSYWHPNGHFYKVVLHTDEFYKYRVHFWGSTLTHATSPPYDGGGPVHIQNPHSHAWDFDSLILCGSLIEHLWKRLDKQVYPPDMMCDEYRIGTGSGCLEPVLTKERAHLRHMDTYTRSAGVKYTRKIGEVHTAYGIPGSITLCLQSRTHVADSCVVYDINHSLEKSHGVHYPSLKESEVVQLLRHLEESFHKESPTGLGEFSLDERGFPSHSKVERLFHAIGRESLHETFHETFHESEPSGEGGSGETSSPSV